MSQARIIWHLLISVTSKNANFQLVRLNFNMHEKSTSQAYHSAIRKQINQSNGDFMLSFLIGFAKMIDRSECW